jgi:hypothetical protein
MATVAVDADSNRGESRRPGPAGIVLAAAVIVLAVALVYARTPAAPFFFDDTSTILLNPSIKGWHSPRALLGGTRPLLNLSYAVTFQLSGESPAGHRLFNIGVHALNALLLYVLVRRMLGMRRTLGTRSRAANGSFPREDALALVAALLFAVHPLQTEAVTYISGRADVLASTFVLVAMLAVASAVERERRQAAAATRLGAVVAAVLALLCKESSAITPLLLFGYEWLVGGRRPWAVVRTHPLMYGALVLTWIVPALIIARFPQYADSAGLAFAASEYGISPWHYMLTEAGVVAHYLRLVVLPWGQVFDYDWPLVTSLADPAFWQPAFLLLTLAGVAWLRRWRAPLHAYAVLWVVVTLAPTSSLLPIADVIAERRMYLPMVGASLLVVLLAADVLRVFAARRSATAAAVALAVAALVACGWLSWRRNALWCDALGLWRDTVSKAPGNPRAHLNLGTRYFQRGDLQHARDELETAIELIDQGQ